MSRKIGYWLIICCLLPAWSLAGPAVSLDSAVETLREDIRTATRELNETREKIAGEKLPLARKLGELRGEVAGLRREAGVLRSRSAQRDSGFARLRDEVAYLEDEIAFAASILSEYRRGLDRRLSPPEIEALALDLDPLDGLLRVESSRESLRALSPLLELAGRVNRRRTGGYAFSGECLDSRGLLHPGRFVQFGPIAYFVSEDGERAGIVGLKLGGARSAIIAETAAGPIRDLAEGREAAVPVDPTGGEAIRVRQSRRSPLEHIRAGGVVMIPILSLGLFCLVVATAKLIAVGRLQTDIVGRIPKILELISEGRIAAAAGLARGLGPPAGPVLEEGIEHRRAEREHLEEVMNERIMAQIPPLEKWLPFLAVAAAAAPLLGLLGTVTGMIRTFNLVTIFGTGQARLLSGGISEALITTEYGLLVAIPALLIHAYLSRRVKKIINNLDHGAVAFINALKHQDGSLRDE